MPIRTTPLITDEYYHVYNRGVAKQNIFLRERDYIRFERTLEYYVHRNIKIRLSRFLSSGKDKQNIILLDKANQIKNVEIVSYCLMPNHFHLLVKQLIDDGVCNWMGKVCNSYTKYINTVNNRVGPIFQGPYKASHISSDQYLYHVSRYIHLNPLNAGIVTKEKILSYSYSSFSQYVTNNPNGTIVVKPDVIKKGFASGSDYYDFCCRSFDYGNSIHEFKNLFIDLGV